MEKIPPEKRLPPRADDVNTKRLEPFSFQKTVGTNIQGKIRQLQTSTTGDISREAQAIKRELDTLRENARQSLAHKQEAIEKLENPTQRQRDDASAKLREEIANKQEVLGNETHDTQEGERSSLYSNREKAHLKTAMATVFRTKGPIQLLTEELFTLKTLDQIFAHEACHSSLRELLDVRGLKDSDLVVAQTALAFAYASQYPYSKRSLEASLSEKAEKKMTTKIKEVYGNIFSRGTSSSFHVPSTFREINEEQIIKHALDYTKSIKDYVLKKAYKYLFVLEKDNFELIAIPRAKKSSEKALTIVDGIAQPQKKPEGDQGFQEMQQRLSALSFTSQKEAKKRYKKEQTKQIYQKHHFDLSSLHLFYKQQQIVSVDTIQAGKETSSKITLADGQALYQTAEASHSILSILEPCKAFLSGNQYERIPKAFRTKQAGKDHWQQKEVDWRIGDNREVYYGEIHPKIALYTRSILQRYHDQGKAHVTILDIAGGNGDLWERIRKDTQKHFPGMSIRYILVDYSEEDVKLANERFQVPGFPQMEAQAFCRDMRDYHFSAEAMKKELGLPPDGVDIVINSGGLLNNTITSDLREPIQFNALYADLLAQDGYGVYSGLTPLLVSSRHHRELSLEIRNLYDFDIERQMHVIHKKESRIDC